MAAEREVTPVFVKMLDRWRATVRSLNESAVGDVLVRTAGGDEPQHLGLAVREPVGQRGRAPEVVDEASVERRAQMIEDRLRGGE